jgi:hypothetical protein
MAPSAVGRHRYREQIARALDVHGLRPRPTTDPSRAYELLKSIYTFEIREAKLRWREKERVLGPQPLEEYRTAVARLKEKYAVLRVPPHHWVERAGAGEVRRGAPEG